MISAKDILGPALVVSIVAAACGCIECEKEPDIFIGYNYTDLTDAKSEGFADGAYTVMDMMGRDLRNNPSQAVGLYNRNVRVVNAYLEDVGDDRRLSEVFW